jgi:hypothetical protein
LDDYGPIDPDEIEWFSTRRGCVHPYGIVVRIFDEDQKKNIEKTF